MSIRFRLTDLSIKVNNLNDVRAFAAPYLPVFSVKFSGENFFSLWEIFLGLFIVRLIFEICLIFSRKIELVELAHKLTLHKKFRYFFIIKEIFVLRNKGFTFSGVGCFGFLSTL